MESTPDLKAAHRNTAIICRAMMSSLLVYAIVVEVMAAQNKPFDGFMSTANINPLRYIFWAVGLSQIGLARIVRSLLLAKAASDDMATLGMKLTRCSIITFAFCEVPAILGLVLFLIGGLRTDFYILLSISWGAKFIYFPRYAEWEKWANRSHEGAS